MKMLLQCPKCKEYHERTEPIGWVMPKCQNPKCTYAPLKYIGEIQPPVAEHAGLRDPDVERIVTFGFTGTRNGMTVAQRTTVVRLLDDLGVTELHHGDCVGADEEVHRAVVALAAKVVVHPPTDSKLRAFCVSGETLVLESKTFLERNRDIVAAGVDGLLATPKDFVCPKSLRGQGTWVTINHAKKMGRRVWIVFPNGAFTS